MAFGVYFHIPYCIQRCTYCDFATYEQFKIMPPEKYVELVKKEIFQKQRIYPPQQLDTIYFGGGTPSLIDSKLIVSLIEELAKYGLTPRPNAEITLEINPATVSEAKLNDYLKAGFNRFSVGAQTFDNDLLKMVHREHNAQQTLDTLALLQRYNLNYSFDILFALPRQTLTGLKNDLDIALDLGAKHISPYCLTVPSGHPLSKGRPPEEEQIEMFDEIARRLISKNYEQYEISNFSIPGYESQHNILYWDDQDYWGLGLSAHSYIKSQNWGARFWNLSSINDYAAQIMSAPDVASANLTQLLPENQFENLDLHQALTDFCHTQLRMMRGLSAKNLLSKFSSEISSIASARLDSLVSRGILSFKNDRWALTPEGIVISNLAFEEMTFLKNELPTTLTI